MVFDTYSTCSPFNTIHMYSGITSGRVLNGELLYTKILEVNLFAFAYRLFRRDFSPLDGTYCNMCLPFVFTIYIFISIERNNRDLNYPSALFSQMLEETIEI